MATIQFENLVRVCVVRYTERCFEVGALFLQIEAGYFTNKQCQSKTQKNKSVENKKKKREEK